MTPPNKPELRKGPFPLKRRRHIRYFLLLWGAGLLTWSVVIGISGQFRYGKQGPMITHESDPQFFWTVVIVTGVIAVGAIVVSIIPFLRALRDEKSAV
jgi:hypothetical protein